MSELIIAVPKGRLLKPLIPLLDAIGLDGRILITDSRRLVLTDAANQVRYILAKPSDVPTYVEYGAADLGVVGKDVLMESGAQVAELLDLGFASCQLVVAVPRSLGIDGVEKLHFNSRVATKYPRIATRYFNNLGLQVEIVKLHGSIELGPMVGLAEAILDITETGSTLKANDLVPIASVAPISARLIANPVKYKVHFQRIEALLDNLGAVVRGTHDASS
ncbi:MAG: ATP phosphoribosyltransferase [Limnochordia bacterium]|jgi:ATP phosphoribosyltransferase